MHIVGSEDVGVSVGSMVDMSVGFVMGLSVGLLVELSEVDTVVSVSVVVVVVGAMGYVSPHNSSLAAFMRVNLGPHLGTKHCTST